MVATDVTEQRAAQRAELQAAIAQREMLVQEVHHRIKNNLQGVAGLMQQIAAKRPEVKGVIAEVVGQVQAIAQVYGLQVGNVGPLRVRNVVEAIAQSVQRTFGHAITFTATGDGADWSLPEAESIPIALTLNELLTNAIKHVQGDSPVRCTLHADAQGVQVEIANRGALPADFRIDHRPATVSGLGLVRALLPRRAAALEMRNEGPDVVARVSLRPPVVAALSPA
jgi:two-component sensor histidine kinase